MPLAQATRSPLAARTASFVLVAGLLAASCGSDSGSASTTNVATSATASVTTETPTPQTTTPQTTTTVEVRPLHLVGLGDSIPGALNCDGCTSFVTVYGRLAETALGRSVEVTNLATNDSLQSPILVDRVLTDDTHREALAQADLVTLHIGLNDLDVVVCGGFSDRACWDALEGRITDNIATILDEITKLRAGQPTAVRVTTMFDPYPGGDGAAKDPVWMGFYIPEFVHFAELTCQTAVAHGAECIDLIPLFNGPNADQDPIEFVQPIPDHVHLNQKGHDMVANAIAAVGFAPIG